MEIVNSKILLEKIKQIAPDGYEVCTRIGVLTTTKAIYYHKQLVFIFLMEYDFEFSSENGITEIQFLEKYDNWNWKIENVIG